MALTQRSIERKRQKIEAGKEREREKERGGRERGVMAMPLFKTLIMGQTLERVSFSECNLTKLLCGHVILKWSGDKELHVM